MSSSETLVTRTRYRGDDYPWDFTITRKSTGAIIDISLWSFTATFNSERDPEDVTNQQFVSTGVFITDGTDGGLRVPFVGNTLPVGDLYYDVSAVDSDSRIRTIEKGQVTIFQDIGK